jgi:hypothetical protein
MNKKYVGLLATAGALMPALSHAAGPSLSDVLVNSGIQASGYVDGSYVASFNKGNALGGGAVGTRAFDTSSNTFTFNQAALNIGYQPTEGFGGFVNVITGQDAKYINASYGSGSSDFALTQAYVQYATGNLTVIGGRFVTLSGFEVINSTLDNNVSRSLLFQNLEPLVHTGVRASYKFSDLITGYLGLSNSALSGQGIDNNKQKTVEAGGLLTPNKAISVGLYEYYGFDEGVSTNGVGPASQATSLTDLTASWQVIDPLQLGLNVDYKKVYSAGDASGGQAYGVAGYINYTILANLKGSLRGEYVKAKAPGYSENDNEVTLTLDYSPASNFDLLGEVRVDGSANDIYPNGSADPKGSESDVAVKAIWKFGTPTGS